MGARDCASAWNSNKDCDFVKAPLDYRAVLVQNAAAAERLGAKKKVMVMLASTPPRRTHFLTDIIDADLEQGLHAQVVTRFPPEPNGFLHIGHAKSICLNFGLARDYGGACHLRLDDTNPTTEEISYVESIQNDVKWLGFDWTGPVRYASDYFAAMHACALQLIKAGKAYVDSQTVEEIRQNRGNFAAPGVDSPFRNRSIADNLALFEQMRSGELADGTLVLRGKVDMAHANVLMRDPLLYRIRHAHHHRTGDKWCIYPMYDYAHPLEDAIEGISHSICTLEFESNRELYDWVLDNTLNPDTNLAWNPRPRQYEFARLALGYLVMSKRKLLQLVQDGTMRGWDDPRMPTIAGMRRRGMTAEALREFADMIGIAKNNSMVDVGKLEYCVRQDLEKRSPRALAVLRPLRVIVENYPENQVEMLQIPWWPNDPSRGMREVPFGRELLIEKEDFVLEPPVDWKRMAVGQYVRLIGAYVVKCLGYDLETHTVTVTYDERSRGGQAQPGAHPSGTIHWLEASQSAAAEIRLYDRLFAVEQPDSGDDFKQHLNPHNLVVPPEARVEPALITAAPGSHWQLVRNGYFFVDPVDSTPTAAVFNRTIGLRDTWGKAETAAEGRPDRQKASVKAKDAPTTRKSRGDWRAELRENTPYLAQRYAVYQREFALSEADADTLTGDVALCGYYEAAVASGAKPATVAKWMLNDLLGLAKDKSLDSLAFSSAAFGEFVACIDRGELTAGAGKQVLAQMVRAGGVPHEIGKQLGLTGAPTLDLNAEVTKVLSGLPQEVARYRAGEQKLFGIFVGAAMKALRGADAVALRAELQRQLSAADL